MTGVLGWFSQGDHASWAAAVVAAAGAGIAFWQARVAVASRKAAERQAAAAESQAEEARKARAATEEQARIADEQLQLLRKERDQRDAPVFAIDVADAYGALGYFAAQVTLRLERGPALRKVAAAVAGDYINSVVERSTHESDPNTITLAGLRPGGAETFHVACDDGYQGSTIHIDLISTERNGDRTWPEHRTLTIPKPPRAPHVW